MTGSQNQPKSPQKDTRTKYSKSKFVLFIFFTISLDLAIFLATYFSHTNLLNSTRRSQYRFLTERSNSEFGLPVSNQNTAALYKRYANSVALKSFVVLTTVNKPIAAQTNLIRILINPSHFAIKRKQTIVFHSTTVVWSDLLQYEEREIGMALKVPAAKKGELNQHPQNLRRRGEARERRAMRSTSTKC